MATVNENQNILRDDLDEKNYSSSNSINNSEDIPRLYRDAVPMATAPDPKAARSMLRMILIVELVVMFYALSKTLVSLSTVQFLRYVIMEWRNITESNITKNVSVCLVNKTDPGFVIETDVERETSRIVLQLGLMYNIPAIFTSLFLGAYSDQIGRKFLFLLPMCGVFVQSLTYTIVSYIHANLTFLYIAEFLSGMSGGLVTFCLACFAFTSDVMTGKKRTFHIAVIDCIGLLSMGTSMLGLGYLIEYVGYTIPYMIACCLTVVGSILILCCVKERNHDKRKTRVKPELKQLLYNIFQFYITNRSGTRVIFLLCLCAQTLALLAMATVQNTLTVFLLGRPICWDSVQIGIYSAVYYMVPAIGTIIFVKVTSRCVSDVHIAIISAVSLGASFLLVGFAKTHLLLYIGVGAGAVSLAVRGMMMAVMSKLVLNGQHGALFASTSAVEAIITCLATTIGNGIYQLTNTLFSGAVFLVTGGVVGLAILILVILEIVMRKKEIYQMLTHSAHRE